MRYLPMILGRRSHERCGLLTVSGQAHAAMAVPLRIVPPGRTLRSRRPATITAATTTEPADTSPAFTESAEAEEEPEWEVARLMAITGPITGPTVLSALRLLRLVRSLLSLALLAQARGYGRDRRMRSPVPTASA
jgi:hypothetical protein